MKDKELLLISHFRSNARKNLTKISKETGIPISTIFSKLKQYEGDVIRKFTSLLDFQKLGYDMRVSILLKVDKEDRENVGNFLAKHSSVNSVFRINNTYDYLIEGIFRNMQEVHQFMEQIEKFKILDKEQFYILDDIKREAFMEKTVI
jgi:DNA-binding Lrp family transcriptional regulator